MELHTEDLILRTLTEGDILEIARMWEYPKEITVEKARHVLENMEVNHLKNKPKAIFHLCLGVFRKNEPGVLIGWCGLDGKISPGQTVLFYTIDEKFRNRGYASQCTSELLRYAFEDMEYDFIYGGCAKENAASYRVMEKAGMVQDVIYEDGGYGFSIDREAFYSSLL